LRRQGAPAP